MPKPRADYLRLSRQENLPGKADTTFRFCVTIFHPCIAGPGSQPGQTRAGCVSARDVPYLPPPPGTGPADAWGCVVMLWWVWSGLEEGEHGEHAAAAVG
jgi:hypothetical protein